MPFTSVAPHDIDLLWSQHSNNHKAPSMFQPWPGPSEPCVNPRCPTRVFLASACFGCEINRSLTARDRDILGAVCSTAQQDYKQGWDGVPHRDVFCIKLFLHRVRQAMEIGEEQRLLITVQFFAGRCRATIATSHRTANTLNRQF